MNKIYDGGSFQLFEAHVKPGAAPVELGEAPVNKDSSASEAPNVLSGSRANVHNFFQ